MLLIRPQHAPTPLLTLPASSRTSQLSQDTRIGPRDRNAHTQVATITAIATTDQLQPLRKIQANAVKPTAAPLMSGASCFKTVTLSHTPPINGAENRAELSSGRTQRLKPDFREPR